MRWILIIGAVLGIFSKGWAQTGSVSGKVTSGGKPVEYALVQLKGTAIGMQTNEQGEYKLADIAIGNYVLEVKTLEHEKFSKKITITENQELKLDAGLIESVKAVDEVVVTGTMKETSKLNSAIAVEVYTPQFFKKQPSPSIFESLSMVNGVQPQLNCSVCNTGDIHINGMEGPYTMVLIDGMPIVSSLSTVYGLSGIPNSLVKRIEVVKGPAATIYGSEAVGGLINIITKDPVTAPRLQVDVMGTTYQDLNVDVSGKAKVKKLTALIGANYYNFNKRWDLNKDNFTDVTLQNRISLFNKWNLERKDNRLASLALRYVYEDRFGGEMQWNKEWRGSDSIYGESIYTRRWELIGSYQLPVKEKLTLQYSYNSHQQNSYYGFVPYMAQQQTAFAQLLWDKKLGARHDLLVGLPFRYIHYDDNTIATQDTNSANPHTKPSVTFLPGIFVQDEIKLSEKWTTLPGIRYDHHNIHGNIFSPRLSFKYSPNKNNTFRLTGGNGFRVVNLFTEDHAALTGSRQVVIAHELKPEESWNVNLNHVMFINHKKGYVGVDASLFYTYFSNKIVGDFLTDPNKIIYDNLRGYAVSQGATLNLDFSFNSGLKLIMGVTLMDVYQMQHDSIGDRKKIPQLFAPKFSGTYQLSYSFRRAGITIDYTGRVNGPMHLPVVANDFRPAMSPWFDIANIQVTKKYKGFEVYAGVKNLWNFLPKNPILRPNDPFDKNIGVDNPNRYTFDTSYNYASMQGLRGFAGIRWIFS